MTTITQNFKTGEEYIYTLSCLPEHTTDKFIISSVVCDDLEIRLIDDYSFGITCTHTEDFTTTLIISVIINSSTTLNINVEWEGKIIYEPFTMYNTGDTDANVVLTHSSASAPDVDFYYCIGTEEGEYTHFAPEWTAAATQTFTIPAGENMYIYSDTMTTWGTNISNYNAFTSGLANITFGGFIYTLLKDNTMTANYAFASLFINSDITTIPELPAKTLTSYCYYSMFKNCNSLVSLPDDYTLPAETLPNSCYSSMFQHCTSLTVFGIIKAKTLGISAMEYMFDGCSSLEVMPDLSNIESVGNYALRYMFQKCKKLTTLTAFSDFSNTAASCQYMFNGCTSLTTIPENMLPLTTLGSGCFDHMFQNCTSLTTVPTNLLSTITTLGDWSLYGMFLGCTKLTNAPDLPMTNMVSECYSYMFQNCKSLTTAPELPALTLVDRCYKGMFSGCSSLSYIKMMATDVSASNCLNSWTSGVASEGTFVKNSEATWDVSGTSGIPEGWTVATATE